MMSRKASDPYWTVRGVSRGEDVCLVIEAESAVTAECIAAKRGIDVVVVSSATPDETATARLMGRLWRYTPEPRLKCCGQAVGRLQAACLVLCGLATVILALRANHVPLRLHWWG